MGKEDPPVPTHILISDTPPKEFDEIEFRPETAQEVANEIANEYHTGVIVTDYQGTSIQGTTTHIPND